jgi:hypothetical protein
MASSVLFRRRKLRAGPPVFGEMQMRVVAESVGTARLERDDSFKGPSSLREHLAFGRRETHGADEPSGPLGFRHLTQRLDEFLVVRGVPLLTSSIDPGPTGASNARVTAEGVDLQTGIVGERGATGVTGVGERLEASVRFKGQCIFDRFLRDGGEIAKPENLDPEWFKNRSNLIQLVRVATGQKDFFHGLIPEKWSEANHRVVASYDSCGLGSRQSEQKEDLDLVNRRNAAIFCESKSPP